jgi:hypothetical protein
MRQPGMGKLILNKTTAILTCPDSRGREENIISQYPVHPESFPCCHCIVSFV